MDKTKKQLLEEIADLRRKIKDFENATSNRPEKIHEMKQSEELYRLLVEHANEVIMVIQNEKIRYVNKKATEITGYSKKELSSRSFIDFIHPADRKLISIDEIYDRHGETAPRHLTCRIVDRKGKTRWVDAKLLGTTWAAKTATICFLIDITERKIDEEALRNSEMKYRQLVEHAPAGIYSIDMTTGKFVSFNDLMCEYTGYTKEEFLGYVSEFFQVSDNRTVRRPDGKSDCYMCLCTRRQSQLPGRV